MTASDVPEAVRPWLDALRAVWPECVVTFSYSFGGWYDVVRWPSRPEGWDCSIHSDGEVAFYKCPDRPIGECFDPASLVARLRELLPVPAKIAGALIAAEIDRELRQSGKAADYGDDLEPEARTLVEARRDVERMAAQPERTYTCERCAISWVTADGARCPGCERAERMERASVEQVAVPLRDASRRLVDEIARYQRAGRGTPLPSEVVAAVEDVRAALEVGGE